MRYELAFEPTNAAAFLTAPGPFVDLVSDAVEAVTGRKPALSTTGGTSDARFIKDYCPVLEFGLVGADHAPGRRARARRRHRGADPIYERVLASYFA